MPAKNFMKKMQAKSFAKKKSGKVYKNPFNKINPRIGKFTVGCLQPTNSHCFIQLPLRVYIQTPSLEKQEL